MDLVKCIFLLCVCVKQNIINNSSNVLNCTLKKGELYGMCIIAQYLNVFSIKNLFTLFSIFLYSVFYILAVGKKI